MILRTIQSMPAWVLRGLADAHPEKAADTVKLMAEARGNLEMACNFRTETEGEELTLHMLFCALSAWLRSGSRIVEIDPAARDILGKIPTPRFHALTTEDDDQPCYLVAIPHPDYGIVDLFLWASPMGPMVSAIYHLQRPEGPVFGFDVALSGPWDILRWHAAQADAHLAEEMPHLARALNAIAAIQEQGEIIRPANGNPRQKRQKRQKRGLRGAGLPSPVRYRLDPTGLTAWRERREAPTQPTKPARDGEPTRTIRLHNCSAHTRRMWVASPADGEPVIATRAGKLRKDGTRATLHCVIRSVEAHAKGGGVRPQIHTLTT